MFDKVKKKRLTFMSFFPLRANLRVITPENADFLTKTYRPWETIPEQVIANTLKNHPNFHLAVLLGETSEVAPGEYLYAFDVDAHEGSEKDAEEALELLCEKHPELRDAPTVSTKRGGYHIYFTSDAIMRRDSRYICTERAQIELLGSGQRIPIPGESLKGYKWLRPLTSLKDVPFVKAKVFAAKQKRSYDNIADEDGQERLGVSLEEAKTALYELPENAEERDSWIRAMMAFHAEFANTEQEDAAYEVFDEWSREFGGASYDSVKNRIQWDYLQNPSDAAKPIISMKTLLSDAEHARYVLSEKQAERQIERMLTRKEEAEEVGVPARFLTRKDRPEDTKIDDDLAEPEEELYDIKLAGGIDGLIPPQVAEERLPFVRKAVREAVEWGFPTQCLRIGGALDLVIAECYNTLSIISPPFAVASALMFGASVLSRENTVNGQTIAMRALLLGETGCGKTTHLRLVESLLAQTGQHDNHLCAMAHTEASIVKALARGRGKVIIMADECRDMLARKSKADANFDSRMSAILALSTAGAVYRPYGKISKELDEELETIRNPALSLLGTTTLEGANDIFTHEVLERGFGNRFLALGGRVRVRVKGAKTPMLEEDEELAAANSPLRATLKEWAARWGTRREHRNIKNAVSVKQFGRDKDESAAKARDIRINIKNFDIDMAELEVQAFGRMTERFSFSTETKANTARTVEQMNIFSAIVAASNIGAIYRTPRSQERQEYKSRSGGKFDYYRKSEFTKAALTVDDSDFKWAKDFLKYCAGDMVELISSSRKVLGWRLARCFAESGGRLTANQILSISESFLPVSGAVSVIRDLEARCMILESKTPKGDEKVYVPGGHILNITEEEGLELPLPPTFAKTKETLTKILSRYDCTKPIPKWIINHLRATGEKLDPVWFLNNLRPGKRNAKFSAHKEVFFDSMRAGKIIAIHARTLGLGENGKAFIEMEEGRWT